MRPVSSLSKLIIPIFFLTTFIFSCHSVSAGNSYTDSIKIHPADTIRKVPEILKIPATVSVEDSIKKLLYQNRCGKTCSAEDIKNNFDYHRVCLKRVDLVWGLVILIVIVVVLFFLKKRYLPKPSIDANDESNKKFVVWNIKRELMHMLMYPAVLGGFFEQIMNVISPIISLAGESYKSYGLYGIWQLVHLVIVEEHFLLGIAFVGYFSLDFLFSFFASRTEVYDYQDLALDILSMLCLFFGFISLNITDYNDGNKGYINFLALLVTTLLYSLCLIVFGIPKLRKYYRCSKNDKAHPWKVYYWTLMAGSAMSFVFIFYMIIKYQGIVEEGNNVIPVYLQKNQMLLRIHICFMWIWTFYTFLMLNWRRKLGYRTES